MNPIRRLVVNGVVREYDGGAPATLIELIESMGLGESRLVAEINGEIVRKDDFGTKILEPDAVVELVKFVGGG